MLRVSLRPVVVRGGGHPRLPPTRGRAMLRSSQMVTKSMGNVFAGQDSLITSGGAHSGCCSSRMRDALWFGPYGGCDAASRRM